MDMSSRRKSINTFGNQVIAAELAATAIEKSADENAPAKDLASRDM
jgi:hypothetical protein